MTAGWKAWKTLVMERESRKVLVGVSHSFHRPWKSLRDSHIPTATTNPIPSDEQGDISIGLRHRGGTTLRNSRGCARLHAVRTAKKGNLGAPPVRFSKPGLLGGPIQCSGSRTGSASCRFPIAERLPSSQGRGRSSSWGRPPAKHVDGGNQPEGLALRFLRHPGACSRPRTPIPACGPDLRTRSDAMAGFRTGCRVHHATLCSPGQLLPGSHRLPASGFLDRCSRRFDLAEEAPPA